jgi:CDP-glycerol glycerophosphotransferase
LYNVEAYVADCLESLTAQSYPYFEAIVVDDGSTDRSAAVVERYAREDPRIRMVQQPNGGLGAARNRGVAEARGSFLTFLDSDDLVTPGAYEAMMSTLVRTGSDLVVGTLMREEGGRNTVTRLMEENHRVRRERVTLSDMPLMLADVFATNKVFRRSFWDAAGLDFPTGIRYEDQPALTRAFVAARSFDVIPDLVYLWRVRGDGTSITQRRHELSDLLDRVESKKVSTALVRDTGHPALQDVWFRDVLPVDMWEYFRAVPGCSDDYWSALRTAMSSLWSDDTVPFEQTRTPVQQRLMGWLVDHGRRDDLARLIKFIDENRGDFDVRVDDDIVFARVPREGELAHAGAAHSVYAFHAHERRWSH